MTARNTFAASAVTSGPMPSPPTTAMSATVTLPLACGTPGDWRPVALILPRVGYRPTNVKARILPSGTHVLDNGPSARASAALGGHDCAPPGAWRGAVVSGYSELGFKQSLVGSEIGCRCPTGSASFQ